MKVIGGGFACFGVLMSGSKELDELEVGVEADSLMADLVDLVGAITNH